MSALAARLSTYEVHLRRRLVTFSDSEITVQARTADEAWSLATTMDDPPDRDWEEVPGMGDCDVTPIAVILMPPTTLPDLATVQELARRARRAYRIQCAADEDAGFSALDVAAWDQLGARITRHLRALGVEVDDEDGDAVAFVMGEDERLVEVRAALPGPAAALLDAYIAIMQGGV